MKTENTGTTGTMRADTVRLWPGVMLGLLLAGIAFALSFDALRVVFAQSGTNPVLSWGGPLCVDGTILLSTWATWGFKKGGIRGQAYPWAGFCLFSLLSIAGNILHAWLAGGGNLPQWAAMAVMAVPPCALMYSTHLIVIIAGDWHDKHAPAAISTASDPGAGAEPHGQSGRDRRRLPARRTTAGPRRPLSPRRRHGPWRTSPPHGILMRRYGGTRLPSPRRRPTGTIRTRRPMGARKPMRHVPRGRPPSRQTPPREARPKRPAPSRRSPAARHRQEERTGSATPPGMKRILTAPWTAARTRIRHGSTGRGASRTRASGRRPRARTGTGSHPA